MAELHEAKREFELGYGLQRPPAMARITDEILSRFVAPIARYTGYEPAAAIADDIANWISGATSNEEKAWVLIYASLCKAADDLMEESGIYRSASTRYDISQLLGSGDIKLDLGEIAIPANIMVNPTAMPVLNQAKAAFASGLEAIGLHKGEAQSVASRLPGHFAQALHELAKDHPGSLDALLNLIEGPFAAAMRQQQAWHFYRARLERQLDAPLFGESISLRQLYQPAQAYYIQKSAKRDQSGEAQSKPQHHVVNPLKHCLDWLAAPYVKEDAIRVIAGGPGSGKSSFVKHLAIDALQSGTPAILLPLQSLNSLQIEDEVGGYAINQGFAFKPLDKDTRPDKLLLILDGLDELDTPDKTGSKAAYDLISTTDRLIENAHTSCELRVILAGRNVIVDEIQSRIDPGKILRVLPFERSDEEIERAEWRDPKALLEVDARKAWWQIWGEHRGTPYPELPDSVAKNRQLRDLSRHPLLNHLIAIAEPEKLADQANMASIYDNLLEKVWDRSWGPKRASGKAQIGMLQRLEREDFDKLFESIGIAVWQHGNLRTTTLAQVKEIAENEGLTGKIPAFEQGAKEGALALLTAFFFRGIEGKAPESFELTHKSFGEYFAARRLRRLAEELIPYRAKPEFALQCWYEQTHAARITKEIVDFLQSSTLAWDLEKIKSVRDACITAFNHNLAKGMPLQCLQAANYRQAQARAAAAELALINTIGALSRAIITKLAGQPANDIKAQVQWEPAWPDATEKEGLRTSLWDLIRRLQHDCALDPISQTGLTGATIIAQLAPTWLADAYCEHTSASHANLSRANLFRANLSRANLSRANLRSADLRSANLSSANLSSADLRSADLRSADLSRANLSSANLRSADLRSANLRDAVGLTAGQLRSARSVEGAILPGKFRGLAVELGANVDEEDD